MTGLCPCPLVFGTMLCDGQDLGVAFPTEIPVPQTRGEILVLAVSGKFNWAVTSPLGIYSCSSEICSCHGRFW